MPAHRSVWGHTARLSPLKHRNLNLLDRYSFTASVPAAGALRPLRDPDAPELDEDDRRERAGLRVADWGGDELAGRLVANYGGQAPAISVPRAVRWWVTERPVRVVVTMPADLSAAAWDEAVALLTWRAWARDVVV